MGGCVPIRPLPLDEIVGIRFESEDRVAVITIDNEYRRNATSFAMHRSLRSVWEEVRDNPAYRCAVVTGSGTKYFHTGADVGGVAEAGMVNDGDDGPRSENVRSSPRDNRVHKPVICAVNGLVAGGGLHLVADSDIVVASRTASFMDTHVNIGMVGRVENVELTKRLPIGQVLRMTLQGRNYRLSAERAYQLGLVDELVDSDELMPTAMALAHDIASNSPHAVTLSKQAIWSSVETGLSQAVDYGYSLVRLHRSHPDFLEGAKAFAERRPPVWLDQ